MKDYKWEITDKSKQFLIELEAVKLAFEVLKLNPKREENLRKKSLLKSSVFSARIEGFQDTVVSPKLESQNLLRGYNLIHSKSSPVTLTIKLIKELHEITLNSISFNAGKWRAEEWGIFNQAGVAVYKAPAHFNVPSLMADYIVFINEFTEHPGIRAAVAQFIFEKIHPFADGNGRVGRLISAHALTKTGYGFRGLAPFEEYIDEHREEYYMTLEPSHNITGFIEFFLEAIIFQSKQSLMKINEQTADLPEDQLPPRQMEILQIIRDHPYCSFDFIQRRFIQIRPSTLRYDITQLTTTGFINKIRKTRGATYLAVS